MIFAVNEITELAKEAFVKCVIKIEKQLFNQHEYYPSKLYKVSDQEVLKLKLIQKQKDFNKVSFDKDIIF